MAPSDLLKSKRMPKIAALELLMLAGYSLKEAVHFFLDNTCDQESVSFLALVTEIQAKAPK